MTERQAMLRAIEKARQCVSEPGRVSAKVGTVVLRNRQLIGEAYRGEQSRGEHAEFTLLEKKLSGDTLAGATLFTTLEPCTSRNDPKIPCVERIIERRIGKVFIGVLDPNKKVRGNGELRLPDAGIDVARFDSDLMPVIEELNRDFSRRHRPRGRIRRTAAETKDPVRKGERGPNGHRIGYTAEGDKVEWIPDEEKDGQVWPLILRRNDNAILDRYNELWEKVWWNSHQSWRLRLSSDKEKLSPVRRQSYSAQRNELRRSRKNMVVRISVGMISSGDF